MSRFSEVGAVITGRFAARADLEVVPMPNPAVERAPSPARDLTPHEQAARVRERYLSIRFPGFPRRSTDLADVAAVVKAARVYLEGGNVRHAQELLVLASESVADGVELWLARIEIAFLVRDGAGFRRTARAFHERHPDSCHWGWIGALGRSLRIDDPRYGGRAASASAARRIPDRVLDSSVVRSGWAAVGLRLRMLSPASGVGPPEPREDAA